MMMMMIAGIFVFEEQVREELDLKLVVVLTS